MDWLFRMNIPGKYIWKFLFYPGTTSVWMNWTIERSHFQIKPDRVQLNTLDRPGTIPGWLLHKNELQIIAEIGTLKC
jgi:hypothetical protein